MPLPKPKKGEKEDDFIKRCMDSPAIQRDFDKQDQRVAVCYRQWRDKDKKPAKQEIEGDEMIQDSQARCAAQHFGPWMVEPYWFMQAVAAVRDGTFTPEARAGDAEVQPYEVDASGIAQIGIYGQMTKGESSFGGTSTVRTRRLIREAARDDSVKAILLHIDSPGGTVAGTAELAADVAGADARKPVHAYIEDLGASAAYWVASQARRVTANATAQVGSIGTVAMLYDTSGRAEKDGIVAHVISTGPYKGAFAPGAKITEEQLDYAREMVEGMNEHLLDGIKHGRGMPIAQVRELADGRMHIAGRAQGLGLIDGVESLDETVLGMRRQIKEQDRASRSKQAQRGATLSDMLGDVRRKD